MEGNTSTKLLLNCGRKSFQKHRTYVTRSRLSAEKWEAPIGGRERLTEAGGGEAIRGIQRGERGGARWIEKERGRERERERERE